MTAPQDNDSLPQHLPWVDPALWAARTSRTRNPATAVFDPVWRLGSGTIYEIKDREGHFRPFEPKREQQLIIWDLYVREIRNLIIPKARRLGCSTLLMLIALDRTMFIAGHKAVLVDKTLADARIKLTDMVRVAWDRLKPMEKKPYEFRPNADEIRCRINGERDWRTLRVTVSGRGGEAHFLVVSEWGTIQFEDQARSNEIKTGAMIAAQFGTRVIETTWKGGKGGDVWAYVKLALSIPDSEKGKGDWFLRFFPWYLDADYATEGNYARVDKATHDYLDLMAAELSVEFTPQQRLWYWMEAQTQGMMMKREFPTVLRECWTAPIEGSIYGAEMDRARTSGRVTDYAIDRALTVDTFSDLGAPANTAMTFVQHDQGRRLIIDHDTGLDVTLAERCRLLAQKGYRYGTHYLPHDGAALQKGGVSYQKEFMTALREAGLPDRVVIVPRTRDVWLGINAVMGLFPKLHFHATNTVKLVEALDAYRRKPDPNQENHFLDEPVHDYTSHPVDSLRCCGESFLAHFLPDTSTHVMTNAYFDPDTLHALAAASVPRCSSQKLGIVVQPDEGRTGLPKTFYQDPNGHFRIWEMPRLGSSYVAAMTGKALQVWRKQERDEHGKLIPAAMVAACLPDERTQQGILADWAADLSSIYGNAMVAPDITSGPAWVALLQASGTPMFVRKMAPQDKRAGTTKPIRKPGWEMTPDVRLQAFQTLQSLLPELDIWCPHTLGQMGMITSGPGDVPTTLEGSGDDWAACAAMAAHLLPLATPWLQQLAPVVSRPQYDHQPVGWLGRVNQNDAGVMG
jgi:hypothetical protein